MKIRQFLAQNKDVLLYSLSLAMLLFKTKYFEPSTREFMINYRVENLESLVAQLKKDGVVITDKIKSFEYGKFVHILDIEGNKIELWEPNDIEYNKIVVGRTKKI